MSTKDAFRSLLNLHKRSVTLIRPDIYEVTVDMSPSNYSRNLEGPSEITIAGKEFVVTKEALDEVSYPRPKRGDRITDAEMGTFAIDEVREMFDFGGAIIGYRLRTS